jgi:hypothetical protein
VHTLYQCTYSAVPVFSIQRCVQRELRNHRISCYSGAQ